MANSLSVTILVGVAVNVGRTVGIERLAQCGDHSHTYSDHIVAGMAERLLADRDDFAKSGRGLHRNLT